MYYAYILQSERFPNETYVGSSADLRKRLAEHNAGKSVHTNKYKPWKLIAYIAFLERRAAEAFERYLKSGSGLAFAVRHLGRPRSPASIETKSPALQNQKNGAPRGSNQNRAPGP